MVVAGKTFHFQFESLATSVNGESCISGGHILDTVHTSNLLKIGDVYTCLHGDHCTQGLVVAIAMETWTKWIEAIRAGVGLGLRPRLYRIERTRNNYTMPMPIFSKSQKKPL